MDLKDATVSFEKKFKEVHSSKTFPPDRMPEATIVCSGGTCAEGEPVPILYLNKDRAVSEWFETCSKMATGSILKWAVMPELIKFQITMADHKERHRVVNDRFAVRAKFIIEGSNG